MNQVISAAVMGGLFGLAGCAPTQELTEQTLASGSVQSPSVQQDVAHSAGVMEKVASTTGESASDLGLADMLASQLGVNRQQAMGGAGSIFALAQKRMQPDAFMQLSSSVPGIDEYLSAVPQSGKSSSMNFVLGPATDLLGEQGKSLGSLASLAGTFQTLGLDSSMISRFVPVVLEYVQGQGGGGAMALLKNALY